jgi:hypothetical protein
MTMEAKRDRLAERAAKLQAKLDALDRLRAERELRQRIKNNVEILQSCARDGRWHDAVPITQELGRLVSLLHGEAEAKAVET